MSLEHSPVRDRQSLEPFVGEKQAAEFLGVSVRTLQRWRTEPPSSRNPLNFYKLGTKRVAYRLSDCARFAEDQSFHSTSEMDASV